MWKKICSDGWGISEANVSCRQLGFENSTDIISSGSNFTGSGLVPYSLDSNKCLGNESRLIDCGRLYENNCSDQDHVKVRCTPSLLGEDS